MKQLKTLGLYLNDEPGDAEALAFARLVAPLAEPESLGCLHVRGLEDPATTPAPKDADLRAMLAEALPPHLAAKTRIHVSQATGLKAILETARQHDLDLLIVGRRRPSDLLNRKAAFHRLARKAPCPVLVVPEGSRPQIHRIQVVAPDASERTRMALDLALRFARALEPRPQMTVQAVFSVPYGSHYAGLSLEEAARHYEALARKDLEGVLAGLDTGDLALEVVYSCAQDGAAAVVDLASANNTDLLVMASHGATLPATALLGDLAERLLTRAPVPMLVVKRKGETTRFLDALLAQFS